MDMMGAIGGEPEEAAEQLETIGGRIRIVLSLQDGLIEAYEELLEEAITED